MRSADLRLAVRRITETGPEIEEVRRIERTTTFSGAFDPATELARSWSRLWIASDDSSGSVAAFLLAWHVADELHVLNVATDPPLRRRGVAATLMRHVVAYAQRERIRLVLLEVRRSNVAAIQLYRCFQFATVSVRTAYYADGEDAVEMALVLDPDTGQIQPSSDEVAIVSPSSEPRRGPS